MIEALPSRLDYVLAFRLSGKLHDEDYKTVVPKVDAAIASEGKARVLAEFHAFKGWDARRYGKTSSSRQHTFTKIERIALVGEKQWEEWMAKVCKPFTMAEVNNFGVGDVDAALTWVSE